MGRIKRVEVRNGVFHVICRGNGRQDITHVRPRYHEGENIILLEFLTDGSERGARKISNMHAKTGTGSAGFRSFLKQMGLKLQDVIGRYDAEKVNDLDGEWWMFKLK